MGPKQAKRPPLVQQGQVGIGAESAIAGDDIAGLQGALGQRHVGQVVGPQRGGDGPDQVAGVGVELHQQMSGREATPLRLHATLAELGAEVGRVGHGEAGAVQEEDAMAVPEGARVGGGVAAAAFEYGGIEPLEEAQRQALAGVAIGRIGERGFGDASEFGDGDVAFEDLSDKEAGGDGGGEQAATAGHGAVATSSANEAGVEEAGGIALDAVKGLGHTKHGGLLR
jgi:hypothetical protein